MEQKRRLPGSAYDFQSEHFVSYVERQSSGSRKPGSYMQLAHAMRPHGHPLVSYAAGCAAAEAAQFRVSASRKTSYSLNKRLSSLGFARAQWSLAAEGLLEAYAAEQDEEKKAEYYAYRMRAMNALGSLPVMAVVSRLHGGDDVSNEEVVSATKAVRRQQLALFREQHQRTDLGKAEQDQRRGFFFELAGHILLQDKFSETGHLITSASIRAGNHSREDLRPNLFATNIAPDHRRVPIQVVSASRTERAARSNVFSVTGREVELPGASEATPTLHVFDQMDQGQPVAPETAVDLAILGDRMAERFNRHVRTLHRSSRS